MGTFLRYLHRPCNQSWEELPSKFLKKTVTKLLSLHKSMTWNVVEAIEPPLSLRRPDIRSCNLSFLHNFYYTRKNWRLRRHFCSLRLPYWDMHYLTNLKPLITASNLFVKKWGWGLFRTASSSLLGSEKDSNYQLLICLITSLLWKMLKNQSLALLVIGVPHGYGDDPRTPLLINS